MMQIERWSKIIRHIAYRLLNENKSIESSLIVFGESLASLVQELLRGSGRLSKADFRSQMKDLIASSAKDIFEEGYIEGKGDPEEATDDDIGLLDTFVNEQKDFVDNFSDWLKDRESNLDEVPNRIETWVASFRNLGQQAKARALGDPTLRFGGEDGEENCVTCAELSGQAHRLSWWQGKNPDGVDYTRRNGNEAYECGHWDNHCQHHFYHARTGELIIA